MITAGSHLGSYRVTRLLGEGGMGAVYEAIEESIERRVAIKVLHGEYARHPEIATRFFNEARTVNRIEHPSLVQVHEARMLPDGTAYIVMELLKGETLAQRLRNSGGKLPPDQALTIARQIADALTAAHAHNIVHRDLKPANVMLVPDPVVPAGERVKILDFGIAKLMSASQQGRTASNVLMGTPAYMSPEQCRGAGRVDGRTDVYALGVMLFETLAGRGPFVAEGSGELIAMHLFQEPPQLSILQPEIPSALVNFVHRLLAKDPAQRPTMSAAAKELAQLLGGTGPSGTAGLSTPTTVARRRLLPWLIGGTVFCGAVLTGVLLTRAPSQSASTPKETASISIQQSALPDLSVHGTIQALPSSLPDLTQSPTVPTLSFKRIATRSDQRHSGGRPVARTVDTDPHAPRSMAPTPQIPEKDSRVQPEQVIPAQGAPPTVMLAPSNEIERTFSAAEQAAAKELWGDVVRLLYRSEARQAQPARAARLLATAACKKPLPSLAKELLAQGNKEAQQIISECEANSLYGTWSRESAAAMLDRATLYISIDCAMAGKLAKQGLRSKNSSDPVDSVDYSLWRVIGLAACSCRNSQSANEAWRRMEASARGEVIAACNRKGLIHTDENGFKSLLAP